MIASHQRRFYGLRAWRQRPLTGCNPTVGTRMTPPALRRKRLLVTKKNAAHSWRRTLTRWCLNAARDHPRLFKWAPGLHAMAASPMDRSVQMDISELDRATETFDLRGFLLAEMFMAEQKDILRDNLLALFPALKRSSDGLDSLSECDVNRKGEFYSSIGCIQRETKYPSILTTRTLIDLPPDVEFIDVVLRRISTHVFLCFQVALTTDANDSLFEKLAARYQTRVEIPDFRPGRLGHSVTYFSAELDRQHVLAQHVDSLVAKIQDSLRPYLREGYFTETKGDEIWRAQTSSASADCRTLP